MFVRPCQHAGLAGAPVLGLDGEQRVSLGIRRVVGQGAVAHHVEARRDAGPYTHGVGKAWLTDLSSWNFLVCGQLLNLDF